jgi:hypothetical protein
MEVLRIIETSEEFLTATGKAETHTTPRILYHLDRVW